jgi:hypothetical protein
MGLTRRVLKGESDFFPFLRSPSSLQNPVYGELNPFRFFSFISFPHSLTLTY